MANKPQIPDDPYARKSFTFRRMTRGQVWAITIVAAIIVVGGIVYATL